jgi:hypothetical protein
VKSIRPSIAFAIGVPPHGHPYEPAREATRILGPAVGTGSTLRQEWAIRIPVAKLQFDGPAAPDAERRQADALWCAGHGVSD